MHQIAPIVCIALLFSCIKVEPSQINSLFINSEEEERRAREFLSRIYNKYGGVRNPTIGVINPRRHDFTDIVAEFASRAGWIFVKGGHPNFLIQYDVEYEVLGSRFSAYDVKAQFIDVGGTSGGVEILYASRKKRTCIREEVSRTLRCSKAPRVLAKAVLYSFIHR